MANRNSSMMSLVKFNRSYLILSVVLFCIEILIAKFAHDQYIRPYLGDLLVVILIYYFIKSFLDTPVLPTSLSVLLFSYTLETLQYFHIVERLGLQKSKLSRIIIGTSFEWIDIVAYTLGVIVVICIEKIVAKRKIRTQ
jgi:Protein of unknown function (DUF2809)